MPLVYGNVEIINSSDYCDSRNNLIDQKDVRRLTVNFLVKTRATTLAINENIQEQLQLTLTGKVNVQLDNDEILRDRPVGPVEVRYKKQSDHMHGRDIARRFTTCIRYCSFAGIKCVD